MTTAAWIMMVLTWSIITYFSTSLLIRVLRSPPTEKP